MIKNIAHLCLAVENLQVMEDFYTKTLGLKKAFDFVNNEGHRFGCYVKVGNRTFIEMFEGKDPAAAGNASYRHICLEVDDVAKTVGEIRARGGKISDAAMGSDKSWQAWINDPEGNAIELHGYTKDSWQGPHL